MSHAAVDSAVGYYYQGMYALLVLLESGDDDACVLIEGDDDIVLDGNNRTLLQLKHSLSASPGPITIRSKQVWKTLKVWIDAPSKNARLVLVTCSPVGDADELLHLVAAKGTPNTGALQRALTQEAERVKRAREESAIQGHDLPHKDRAPGVDAFLNLSSTERQALLQRIVILPNSPKITDVRTAVVEFYKGWISPEFREPFVDKLLEWWSYRVCRSLINEMERTISRSELYGNQRRIQESFSNSTLPDDYGRRMPDNPREGLTSNMERQIDIVNGGDARKIRASLARWRARHQREVWLSRDLSIGPDLVEFDERLVARWRERFDPVADDLAGSNEEESRKMGRVLLDWSHLKARNEVTLRGMASSADYVVPGSYQQLADELAVGWHVNFADLCAEEKS